MFPLKHLRSFCLAGSKKTQQQEFTSHLGATITKSWEWQRLIAAEDTGSPKQKTQNPRMLPLQQRKRGPSTGEGASSA